MVPEPPSKALTTLLRALQWREARQTLRLRGASSQCACRRAARHQREMFAGKGSAAGRPTSVAHGVGSTSQSSALRRAGSIRLPQKVGVAPPLAERELTYAPPAACTRLRFSPAQRAAPLISLGWTRIPAATRLTGQIWRPASRPLTRRRPRRHTLIPCLLRLSGRCSGSSA